MPINSDDDVLKVQKRINELRMVLLNARKNIKEKEQYEDLSRGFLLGIKSMEDELYEYLSKAS